MDQPLDIKKEWLSVARRMQSVSCSEGLSIVSISVLVNSAGVPIFWSEPKKILIEPKAKAGDIINSLSKFENGFKENS
jgi:hypothetical protein